MLQTIAVILIVLWAIGLFGGFALGGLLHLLLITAAIMLAFRFFTGRKVL